MALTDTYLGFDYGERRIGLAVGQALTQSARPLQVLARRSPQFWPTIERLVDDWRPNGLVVGISRHADGSATPLTHAIEAFCEQLSTRFELPLATIDERLTSHEAAERARANGVKLQYLDAWSAAVILETFLAHGGQDRHPV